MERRERDEDKGEKRRKESETEDDDEKRLRTEEPPYSPMAEDPQSCTTSEETFDSHKGQRPLGDLLLSPNSPTTAGDVLMTDIPSGSLATADSHSHSPSELEGAVGGEVSSPERVRDRIRAVDENTNPFEEKPSSSLSYDRDRRGHLKREDTSVDAESLPDDSRQGESQAGSSESGRPQKARKDHDQLSTELQSMLPIRLTRLNEFVSLFLERFSDNEQFVREVMELFFSLCRLGDVGSNEGYHIRRTIAKIILKSDCQDRDKLVKLIEIELANEDFTEPAIELSEKIYRLLTNIYSCSPLFHDKLKISKQRDDERS